jgi:5-methylcytosine-specific restriction endonuclease McrA
MTKPYPKKKRLKGKRLDVFKFNRQARADIKLRDERCILCGSVYNLQFHHIVYKSHRGMGVKENGVLLCLHCHKKAHEKAIEIRPILEEYIKGYYPGWSREQMKYRKHKKLNYINIQKGVN